MSRDIVKKYLEFPNAVVLRQRVTPEQWQEPLIEFAETIASSENYQVSPIGVHFLTSTIDNDDAMELEYFASLGFDVLYDDSNSLARSTEDYLVGTTIMKRLPDDDVTTVEQVYGELAAYARAHDIIIGGDFYQIILSGDPDTVIDIHAKVLEDNND